MEGAVSNVLSDVLEVFGQIGGWIPTAVEDLMPIFWSAADGLSFLGVLAVAGLAFSVVFLVMGLIQNFLHFRG